MARDRETLLLQPGESIRFEDRDDLLGKLDLLDPRVPRRYERRRNIQTEQWHMVRYLRILAGADRLVLPVRLERAKSNEDPPDFTLHWPREAAQETFELIEGSTEEYQKQRTLASRERAERRRDAARRAASQGAGTDHDTSDGAVWVDFDGSSDTPTRWADILSSAFEKKSRDLLSGRFNIHHLLIYDQTGLSFWVPLEEGAAPLRERLAAWNEREQPAFRFSRVSVVRDQALLFDVGGEEEVVPWKDSPYFSLPVIHAWNEADLRDRLRKLDRYCRDNGIRSLRLFGSILGDRADELAQECHQPNDDEDHLFGPESDLDLLVAFEPGTRVTLFDMARMERELSRLTGFEVDLRTAGDLSRYFRNQVLQEAVESRERRAG